MRHRLPRLSVAILLLIFLVATGLRLSATFALHRWDDPAPGVNRQLAVNLFEHGTLAFREFGHYGPSSVATPAYPTLLAGLFAMFGGPENPTSWFAALALNAAFGGATAVLVVLLARRCGAPWGWAAATGVVVAFWPAQVVAAQFAQPMVLAGMLALLACLLWRRAVEHAGTGTWVAFAFVASVASMLLPALLPALATAWLAVPFVRRWSGDVRLRNAVLFSATVGLVWLPWLGRNHAIHGQPVVTTRFWQQAWSASNPNATGSDRLPLTPERRLAARGMLTDPGDEGPAGLAAARIALTQADLLTPRQRAELAGQPEAAREALFARWTIDAWRDARSPWLAQLPVRLGKAWAIDWDHPMSRHPLALVPRLFAALAAGAAVFMLPALRRRTGHAGIDAGLAAMLVALLSTVLAQATLLASAKTVVTVEPIQIAFAAVVAGRLLADRAVQQADLAAGAVGIAPAHAGRAGFDDLEEAEFGPARLR